MRGRLLGDYDTARLKAYLDCRLDRLERGIVPTPAPTVTVTASPAPAPTVTVTTSPEPAPTVTVTSTPSPGPTVTVTATPTVSATPTATPSTTSPTPSPTQTAVKGWPDATTTGVPADWTPKTTRTGDYTISQDGAVVEDLRITDGTLWIRAANVTLRRVELVNSRLWNEYNNYCGNGLVVEDSTWRRTREVDWDPIIGTGGMTLRRIHIDNMPEGIRVAGNDTGGRCQPLTVEDSFLDVRAPDTCTDNAMWHGDGIQGYMGVALTVRNTRIDLTETTPSGRACGGTAPFFYPGGQGNTRADIDGLLLSGGSYSLRLTTPGSVKGVKIVDRSWVYGPTEVACNQVTWGAGNEIVTRQPDGTLTKVRDLPCK